MALHEPINTARLVYLHRFNTIFRAVKPLVLNPKGCNNRLLGSGASLLAVSTVTVHTLFACRRYASCSLMLFALTARKFTSTHTQRVALGYAPH